MPGETVTVAWQQTSQHFVMTPVESSVHVKAGAGLDEPGKRLWGKGRWWTWPISFFIGFP